MTGKLTVDTTTGRVTGPAEIEYNTPFPTVNGRLGSGAIQGVVMHTMVGNLPGTIAEFNNPKAQASAHFGIAQDGTIHQFGPIGKGWIAWAQEAGNGTWYSIEHADGGNPDTPLTDAQLTASAQLTECLSAFAGFPLQVTDSPTGRGLGTHSMGGAAWGGHTCPDTPPNHVRSAQRAEVIRRAKAIRNPPPPPKPSGPVLHVTAGQSSLAGLAAQHHTSPSIILRVTLEHSPGRVFPLDVADYVNGVLTGRIPASAVMPAGLALWLPGTP